MTRIRHVSGRRRRALDLELAFGDFPAHARDLAKRIATLAVGTIKEVVVASLGKRPPQFRGR